MINPTSDDDPSEPHPASPIDRICALGAVLVLLSSLGGCGLDRADQVTTFSPVISPADEMTIEILGPHSDYTNHIRLVSPPQDLSLINTDIGKRENIQFEQGQEITFEIQPLLSGSPVAGPWVSGPGSRNADGEVHALVTTVENSACLLVSFEDEDADDWGAHPAEPDYSDVLFWVYPTESPSFDTSECPQRPVSVPDE